MPNPDRSTPTPDPGRTTLRDIERAVSHIETAMRQLLAAWERTFAAFTGLDWPLSVEPAGLDTWEGEGGFVPAETSTGRELHLAYDTTPVDLYHQGCAGCQSCFAEMIDEEDLTFGGGPCTRYPECDEYGLPDHEACIWPSCVDDATNPG